MTHFLHARVLKQQAPGTTAVIPVTYPYGSYPTGYSSTTGSVPGLLGTHGHSPSDPSTRGSRSRSRSRSVTSIWQRTPDLEHNGRLSHRATAWLRPSAGPLPEQHRVPRTPWLKFQQPGAGRLSFMRSFIPSACQHLPHVTLIGGFIITVAWWHK